MHKELIGEASFNYLSYHGVLCHFLLLIKPGPDHHGHQHIQLLKPYHGCCQSADSETLQVVEEEKHGNVEQSEFAVENCIRLLALNRQ